MRTAFAGWARQACHVGHDACWTTTHTTRKRPTWPWSSVFHGRTVAHLQDTPPRRVRTHTSTALPWQDHCHFSTSHRHAKLHDRHFFDRHPPSSPDEASDLVPPDNVTAFRTAVDDADPLRILTAYQALVAQHNATAASTSQPAQSPLLQDDVRRAVDVLAAAARERPNLHRACAALLQDMQQRWHWRIDADDARKLVCARLWEREATEGTSFGSVRLALAEAAAMWRHDARLFGQGRQWLRLLATRSAARHRAKGWRLCWRLLARLRIPRGHQLRDAYMETLFHHGLANRVTSDLFEQDTHAVACVPGGQAQISVDALSAEHIPSLAIALSGLCRSGLAHHEYSRRISAHLLERMRGEGSTHRDAWHSLFVHAAREPEGSAASALALCREAVREHGLVADERTFDVLLRTHEREMRVVARPGGSEEDVAAMLTAVERAARLGPSPTAFAMGISTLLGSPPSLDHGGHGRGGAASAYARPSAATPGQVHEAYLLYQRFRTTGMPVSSELALPLVRAYTRSFLPQMDRALQIYRDVREGVVELRARWERFGASAIRATQQEAPVIDGRILMALLEGAVASHDVDLAAQILRDFTRDADLAQPLPRDAASRLVLGLFGVARTYRQAMSGYAAVRDYRLASRGRGEPPFASTDWRGFLAALRSAHARFCSEAQARHDVDRMAPPPIDHVLALLSDQSVHGGGPPDLATLTTLLDFYGKSATRLAQSATPTAASNGAGGGLGAVAAWGEAAPSAKAPTTSQQRRRRSELLDACAGAVLRLHDLLRSLVTLQPDMALMTALMDAYNRANLPLHVRDVWNRLLLAHARLHPATLSVMLDACGRQGWEREARRAWAWARNAARSSASSAGAGAGSQRGLCNRRAWEAYAECLARCGHTDEAIETLVEKLPRYLEELHGASSRDDDSDDGGGGGGGGGGVDEETKARDKGEDVYDAQGREGASRAALEMMLRFAARDRDRRLDQRGNGGGGALRGRAQAGPTSTETTAETAEEEWERRRRRIREARPEVWGKIRHVGLDADHATGQARRRR